MQKENMPMDRAQRVDEWNGVICFVIMFTPRVMAIKMSKWVIIFFVFFADDNKTLVTAGTKYLSASGRSYRVLSENGMIIRLWSLWDIEHRNCWISKRFLKSCIFKGWYLANSSSEPNNPWHFVKEWNKIFQMHLNNLPKLWIMFCCCQQKNTKDRPFLTF